MGAHLGWLALDAMWPRSRSRARLQYSVTQFMSWVTSTMLAALTSSSTRALDFRPEVGIAGRENLVEQQDVEVDEVAIAKPSRARIPDR